MEKILKNCCIVCKNWSAIDKDKEVMINGNKVYPQRIRLCGVHKKETGQHEVCTQFEKDNAFLQKGEGSFKAKRKLQPYIQEF